MVDGHDGGVNVSEPAAPGTNWLLSQLYTPGKYGQAPKLHGISFHDLDQSPPAAEDQGLPVPPLGRLTMGYGPGTTEYLARGRQTASMIRAIIGEHGPGLDGDSAVLDWGCTTGRVLRCFAEEAKTMEVWGVDVDRMSIDWATAHLSPPFRFLCTSSYPTLPFPDGTFSLIYGISVMTHIEHLRGMWLMELRRILKPGGLAVLTIHDEHTVKWFKEHGSPSWIPEDCDLDEVKRHQVTVIRSRDWFYSFTFLRNDYIRQAWGQYFDVVAIQPYAEGYQSAVVLRRV